MENQTEIKPVSKNWYVVNTYSSHENKVKEALEKRIESHNLQDIIFRIIVAEQEVPVMKEGKQVCNKDGKPKTKMKNLYPGYVFVEMIMTDEAWYVVRNTPGVTGFIGSSGGGAKPFPVQRDQIETVLKRIGIKDEDMFSAYNIGDKVNIINGSFEGQEGIITSINEETEEVTVQIMFFGRETSVPVNFTDIDIIKD